MNVIDSLPYSDELLMRVTDAIASCRRDHGNHIQTNKLAAALLAGNVGLVDTSRTTFLVDARVHEGVLFRLHLQRQQNQPHRIVQAETWKGLPT